MFNYVENKPTATERVEIVKTMLRTTSFSLKTNVIVDGVFTACVNNQTEIFKILCESSKFELIMCFDQNGKSILSLACEKKRTKIVKILSQIHGLETLLDHTDSKGWTVIHEVCKNNSLNILKILSEIDGFNTVLNRQDLDGRTAFYIACQSYNLKIMRFLSQVPGFLNLLSHTDKQGKTVLM